MSTTVSGAAKIADVTGLSTLQNGETYIIKNYAVEGDGGGGTFRVEDASAHGTPDDGLVFSTNTTGSVLVRLWDEINMYVDWYNPDASNCQPQLVKALAALDDVGGGRLIFGARTYTATQEWLIQDIGNIHILGQGQGVTIFLANHTAQDSTGIRFVATAPTIKNITFSDMTVEGPLNGNATVWGLILFQDNFENLLFERLTLRRARRYGIRSSLSVDGTTKRVTVRDCNFEEINSFEMDQNAGGALTVFGLYNVTVDNCDFIATGTINTHHAIYMNAARDVTITNCRFEGKAARIHQYSDISENILISGNRFRGVENITLHDTRGGQFSENVIYDSTFTIRADSFEISDNFCLYSEGFSTYLPYATPFSVGNSNALLIEDNRILYEDWETGGEYWIQVSSPTPVVIRNNVVRSKNGIYFSAGTGHVVEGNNMTTSYGEALINTVNSASGIISRNNYFENGKHGTLRVFWGVGTGHTSHADTFKIVGDGVGQFEAGWTLSAARFVDSPVRTLGVNEATPSIIGGGTFETANTAATTITDFLRGAEGGRITILFTESNTTVQHGTDIKLAGGANFVGTADDILQLVHIDGVWYEESRSVN